MDPVSSIVLSACKNLASKPVRILTEQLREVLASKFGEDSIIVQAIDKLMKDSNSQNAQQSIKDELDKEDFFQDKQFKEIIDSLAKQVGATTTINQHSEGTGSIVIGKIDGNPTITQNK